MALHELIKDDLRKLKLQTAGHPDSMVSSTDPAHHADRHLRSMWLAYGDGSIKAGNDEATNLVKLCMLNHAHQTDMSICWRQSGTAKEDRNLQAQQNDIEYRKHLYLLSNLRHR